MIKKFLILILLGLTLTVYAADPDVFKVRQGGTGADTLPTLLLQGNGKLPITGTSSPTFATFTATSTTASSTAANGINLTGGCFSVSGVCLTSNTSGLTGSGVPGRATFWDGVSSITSDSTFLFDSVADRLTFTYASTTGLTTSGTIDVGIALVPDTNGGAALGSTFNGFSTLWLKDSASAFDVGLQITNTGAAGSQNLTFDVGNFSPTLTFSGGAGNPTLGDWFDQSVKTTASPTFAGLTVDTLNGFVGANAGVLYQIASSSLALPPGAINLTKGNFLVGNDAGVAQATSTIFISSMGNIGIGSTTPWGMLSVTQTGTAGEPSFIVEDSASPDSSPFIIDQAGFVGIGTSTPTSALHIVGSGFAGIQTTRRTGVNGGGDVGVALFETDGKTVGDANIFSLSMLDSADVSTTYGRITAEIVDPTNGTEDSDLKFSTLKAGVNTEHMMIKNTGNVGIATSSPWGMLSVTHAGTGPSFVVEDQTSPDTSPFIVDASGNVGIGTPSPINGVKLTTFGGGASFSHAGAVTQPTLLYTLVKQPAMQLVGGDNNENFTASFGMVQPSVGSITARGPEIYFASTRATGADINAGTYSPVQNLDQLGIIYFGGDRSTDLRGIGAAIAAVAQDTWTSTSYPTKLTLFTTASGGSAVIDRLSIAPDGTVVINDTGAAASDFRIEGLSSTHLFFADAGAARVGIGTSTPTGKLSVLQTGTSGAPSFIVEDIASPDPSPFVIDQAGLMGVGTSTPRELAHIEDQVATSTMVISTKAAAKGGRIILEDVDGAGCTEVTALNGVLSAKTVTCPVGI